MKKKMILPWSHLSFTYFYTLSSERLNDDIVKEKKRLILKEEILNQLRNMTMFMLFGRLLLCTS